MSEIDEEDEVKTCPFDPRFPNSNQTYNCYVNFCDYYRCEDLIPGDPRCQIFKYIFNELCPNYWIEKWEQQRADKVFAGEGHIIRVPKMKDPRDEPEEEVDVIPEECKKYLNQNP